MKKNKLSFLLELKENKITTLYIEKLSNFLALEEKLGNPLELKYQTKGSVAFDLFAIIDEPLVMEFGKVYLIPTGLAFIVPNKHVLQFFPRSGTSVKNGITVPNSCGIIDQDFRIQAFVALSHSVIGTQNQEPYIINPGERIAQALLTRISIADLVYTKVDDITGRGGFGSTGK